MDGSWEYHAKWNKADGKSQEPYDYTHMWDIKLKTTDEKTTDEKTRQTNTHKTHRHRQLVVTRGKVGCGEVVKGKGSQIYGDGKRGTLGSKHKMQYTDDIS